MIPVSREVNNLLLTYTKVFPAVAILGPRQIGKTTLSKQFAEQTKQDYIYLDLESGQDLAKIQDDPEQYLDLHQDKLVIIDEIQCLPILFTRLRSIIDRNRRNGRFLLLGSASPTLVKGVSETLAGRIAYLELNPFNWTEVSNNFSLHTHWYRGGFPLALLATSNQEYMLWMSQYIRSYVERDLSILFGSNLNSTIIQRLWLMLAHHHGGIINMEDFARSIGRTNPVISQYIDYLEGAFLIYKLKAWHNNLGKRLVKSSKIYIRDSGILHSLLQIPSHEDLLGHPVVGASWEGYVIDQIRYQKHPDIDVYFYRTQVGAEVDVLLVKSKTPIACIEIKINNNPNVSRGFYTSIEDLETTQNFVITPSSDTYPMKKNTMVCSIDYFLKNYLPKLS